MRTLLKKDLTPYFLMLYKTLQTPEERKSFLESYSYFVSVEQSLGVKLEPIEYTKLIDLGKFRSKQDINRALFTALHKENTNTNTNLLGIDKTQLTDLSKQVSTRNSDTINGLVQTIKNLESNITQYSRYIDSYCSQLFTAKNQLSAYSANNDISDRIITQFDLIMKNNDFIHVYYDPNTKVLHAVTAHDCILNDTDDYKIYNFGKFDIQYDFIANHIHVLPFVNNLTSTEDVEYMHPHLFRNKDMCFGSAQASMVECKKSFEIAKIFTICNMILHDYNPASPTLLPYRFNSQYTTNGYRTMINRHYYLSFHKLLIERLNNDLVAENNTLYVEYIPDTMSSVSETDEVEAA